MQCRGAFEGHWQGMSTWCCRLKLLLQHCAYLSDCLSGKTEPPSALPLTHVEVGGPQPVDPVWWVPSAVMASGRCCLWRVRWSDCLLLWLLLLLCLLLLLQPTQLLLVHILQCEQEKEEDGSHGWAANLD